jgi:hypothetical protein
MKAAFIEAPGAPHPIQYGDFKKSRPSNKQVPVNVSGLLDVVTTPKPAPNASPLRSAAWLTHQSFLF